MMKPKTKVRGLQHPDLLDNALGEQAATIELHLWPLLQTAQRPRAVFADKADAVNVDAQAVMRTVEKACADIFEQLCRVASQPSFNTQYDPARIFFF
jgi:hypothetical protein